MKKIIWLLFALILLSSCKKEEDPTLTGSWSLFMTFTVNSNDTFDGTLTLTQKSDNSLTGQWVMSDNSGTATLTPISKLTGTAIKIGLVMSPYTIIFDGNVRADFNYMNGTFSSSGVNMGTWEATRK